MFQSFCTFVTDYAFTTYTLKYQTRTFQIVTHFLEITTSKLMRKQNLKFHENLKFIYYPGTKVYLCTKLDKFTCCTLIRHSAIIKFNVTSLWPT